MSVIRCDVYPYHPLHDRNSKETSSLVPDSLSIKFNQIFKIVPIGLVNRLINLSMAIILTSGPPNQGSAAVPESKVKLRESLGKSVTGA